MKGAHFTLLFQIYNKMKKLNCILLIDDDEPTNFLHELIIREMGCTENIVTVQSGKKALEYLKSQRNGKYPQPDLIFLDINMPAMNGWEFLEEYKKLHHSQKGKVVVVMLTTSLNPDDEERANSCEEIDDFKIKPLTQEMLAEIIDNYFSVEV